MSKSHIISGAVILAVSSLVSRLLGLIRDRLFAIKFGALSASETGSLDAYYAAFRIPDMIFQLVIIGAVSAALVPIFSEHYYGGEKEKAWKFLDTTIVIVGMLMLFICGLLFVLAPWITPLFVPGFSEEKIKITTDLSRIMLISPILFSVSSIFQGIENATKRYVHFGLAAIVYNLSIITATTFFADTGGVYAIAWGVVAGAMLHALVQIPAIWSTGYRFKGRVDIRSKELHEFIKLAAPRIITIGTTELNMLINTIIASTFAGGSIAVFNFAFNIQSLPLGLIGVSISIVAFGIFSEQKAKEDNQGMIETLKKKMENIAVYIIPATFGLIILRNEIVNTILKGGNFSGEDAKLTASLLAIFALSLLGQNLIPLLSRYFFAHKNTITPMKINITGLIVGVSGSLMVGMKMGYGIRGIVASYSTAVLLQLVLLLSRIRNQAGKKLLEKQEKINTAKILIATVSMSVITILIQKSLQQIISESITRELMTIILGAGVGYMTYRWSLKLLKYENYEEYMSIKNIRSSIS